MRTALFSVGLILAGLVFGTGRVLAAMTYGSGTYVNLCGSGTSATRYSCDPGCNPTTGVCQSTNRGVVKYVCAGRWDQCLDAEGYFSNSEAIGEVACGRTVQLSLYDKACRREDGSWDSSCSLLGYMTWYSGDCWNGTGTPPTPLPTRPISSSPTVTLTPTPTVRATLSVTPTGKVTGTPIPSVTGTKACGVGCGGDATCGAGFSCVSGVCRNPNCPSDKSCFCGKVEGASTSGTPQTPDTGGEIWLILGVAGLVGGGLMAKKFAKALW